MTSLPEEGAHRRGGRLSIKIRLLILVMTAALPAVVLQVWSELDLRQQRAAEAGSEVSRAARLVAAEQDQYFETARTVLATYLDSPVVRSGDREACSAYLARLHQRFPAYTGFGVATPDGVLVCSSNPRLIGARFQDRDYFQEALGKRDFAVGDVTPGPASSRWIVGAAYPLIGPDGSVALMGLLGLDLQRWSESLGVSSLPQGTTVLALDSRGVIMAHAPEPGRWIGRPTPFDLGPGHDQQREIDDADGVRRLYGFAPLLRDERLSIAVGMPISGLYGHVDRLFWRELILLLAVFLAMGIAAWVVGEMTIRRPLESLQDAILRLRSGDLSARSSRATTVPELIQLGRSFDFMAASVEQNQQQLRSANANLVRALAARELLINELNHRVKNTLATVQSIASHTLRSSGGLEAVRAAFEARLLALSATHNILTEQNWSGAELRDLLSLEARPFDDSVRSRFTVTGEPVRLPARAAVIIGMAFHELTTNAVKYGALSTPTGTVHVDWSVAHEDGTPVLHLEWRERGGPPVAAPLRRGFGSRLIERSVAAELGGEVKLAFASEGLRCTMTLPLRDEEDGENEIGKVA